MDNSSSQREINNPSRSFRALDGRKWNEMKWNRSSRRHSSFRSFKPEQEFSSSSGTRTVTWTFCLLVPYQTNHLMTTRSLKNVRKMNDGKSSRRVPIENPFKEANNLTWHLILYQSQDRLFLSNDWVVARRPSLEIKTIKYISQVDMKCLWKLMVLILLTSLSLFRSTSSIPWVENNLALSRTAIRFEGYGLSFILSINILFFFFFHVNSVLSLSFIDRKKCSRNWEGAKEFFLVPLSRTFHRDAAWISSSASTASLSLQHLRVIGVQSIFHVIKNAKRNAKNAAVMRVVGQWILMKAAKREIADNGYRRFSNKSLIILKDE